MPAATRWCCPGNADSYSAILSGSFVTIAGGEISIAIPVGLAGLTVDFADGDRSLRYRHHRRPGDARRPAGDSGGTAVVDWGAAQGQAGAVDGPQIGKDPFGDEHGNAAEPYRLDPGDSFAFA